MQRPLWTNPSLWYPAGDCWRSMGLEKGWDVHGGVRTWVHTGCRAYSQWCSKPQRTAVVF